MPEQSGCANPLLLSWLKDWLDTARQHNSKGVNAYKNAYESLQACPLQFQHPAELQQLKGFGPKLCDRLTSSLEKHCKSNGLPMPEHPQAANRLGLADGAQSGEPREGAAAKKRKSRHSKTYVPTFRSGAYALIIGLSSLPEDSTSSLTKLDLIELSQPHCDSSFAAPSDPTKYYTAWNSIKTLIQKELVYERGRPLRRYALTDDGWEIAKRIKQTPQWQSQKLNESTEDGQQQPKISLGSSERLQKSPAAYQAWQVLDLTAPQHSVAVAAGEAFAAKSRSLPDFIPVVIPRSSFSVHLVLDVREVRSKRDRDYMQEELAKQGTNPIMRNLEVGDVQWIAKCHDANLLPKHAMEGDEIVLDWIAERKRLDDLIGSIKDGRFHEQKFRLRKCGAKKVVYIIEDVSIDLASYQRYEEAVESAIASTQVLNGFFVKRTAKIDDTIKYLASLTRMLKQFYAGKTLHVIPTKILTPQNYLPLLEDLRDREPSKDYYITYPAFASLASKSDMMTLRDVFLKMLMTIKGVSGERALEIQKRWKTPYDFVKAFEACGPGEQGKKRKEELVSSECNHLIGSKKIGKALSRKIAEVWAGT